MKEYLVTHNAKTNHQNFSELQSQNNLLKQDLKEKIEQLSHLDPQYKILNDTITIIPTILIACNDEMIEALKLNEDVSVEENGSVYAL